MNELAQIDESTGELTDYNPVKNAMEIHISEAGMKIAKRVGNVEAYHKAVDATMKARLEFVRQYKAEYPHKNRYSSGASTCASTPEEYCNQAGLALRTVQSYLCLTDPVKFNFKTQEMKNRVVSTVMTDIETGDVIAIKHTGDEESYTPEQYIESARKVMGGIDLDPASNDMAQHTVMAAEYYTVEDDGLTKDWHGKVWMNPPYTARIINQFITKLVDGYNDGSITDAIVLTNNNTDTAWFHEAVNSCSAVCFTAGRINFVKRDGSTSSPTNGQSFLYFGKHLQAFKKEFSAYGSIMEIVR